MHDSLKSRELGGNVIPDTPAFVPSQTTNTLRRICRKLIALVVLAVPTSGNHGCGLYCPEGQSPIEEGEDPPYCVPDSEIAACISEPAVRPSYNPADGALAPGSINLLVVPFYDSHNQRNQSPPTTYQSAGRLQDIFFNQQEFLAPRGGVVRQRDRLMA